MRKYLLIVFLVLGYISNAQFAATSAKTKFVNGISIGSKDSTYFTNAGDTVILYIGRDSAVYTKFKGSHRKLAFDGSLSAYKLISDSLFNNGYTTRARTKQLSDSLAAVKLNISDTATMLSNYRRSTTKITNTDLVNSTISGVSLGSNLNNLSFGNGLTGATSYNGSAAQSIRVDTSQISTKANVTASLLGYLPKTAGVSQQLTDILYGTGAFFRNGSSSIADLTTVTLENGGENGVNVAFKNAFGDLGQIKVTKAGAGASADEGLFRLSLATNSVLDTVLEINNLGNATITGNVKSAGIIQPISIKTSNYTLTANDHTVIFDVSGGNKTATLPAGTEGQIFVIKIKGSNSNFVTITPNGSETIEGNTSWAVQGCDGSAITIQFVSGNWNIISNYYATNCF